MPYYTIRLYGDFVPDSVGPPLLLLLRIMPCDFPSWPFSQSGVAHLFCDSLITVPMRAGAILLAYPSVNNIVSPVQKHYLMQRV